MAFPPAFLDELRLRLPLSEVIGKRTKIVRSGREYKGCCPFHKEKTPSFYVNDDKQFYHCFGCGAHGDIIGFTMRYDHLSFPEAIEQLAAQAGIPVPKDTPIEREKFDKAKKLITLLERATVFFEEQLRAPGGREARTYLKQRGLGEDAVSHFRLGYAPTDAQAIIRTLQNEGFTLPEMLEVGLIKKAEDRPDHYSFFRHRLMFPVGDRRGQTVAFGGRVMGEGEPKYLNSPDHPLFHKGKLLYGLSRARAAIAQGQPLIVVEGYMDVIALVEAGFIGALAPLGTAMTEDQLALIWKLLPPLDARDPAQDYSPILCFDGDGAGYRAAARGVARALPLLTPAQTVRVAYIPEPDDPDSLIKAQGPAAMQAILDRAKPMADMLWDLTMANRRLQTPEDRATASRAIRQKILQIKDEGLRKLYQDDIEKRLADLFHWPSAEQATVTPRNNRFTGVKKNWKDRPGQRSFSESDSLPRPQPRSPLLLREKILLALMVNHPELYNEFGEELSRIGFSDASLEALRQQVVVLFEGDTNETLDVGAIYRHLSQGNGSKSGAPGLADVLSEATYVHAGFARPDRPLEQARQGWKSIWNKYLQEQLQTELHEASRLWRQEKSDAALARMMALRDQAEALAHESAMQESDAGVEDLTAPLS